MTGVYKGQYGMAYMKFSTGWVSVMITSVYCEKKNWVHDAHIS